MKDAMRPNRASVTPGWVKIKGYCKTTLIMSIKFPSGNAAFPNNETRNTAEQNKMESRLRIFLKILVIMNLLLRKKGIMNTRRASTTPGWVEVLNYSVRFRLALASGLLLFALPEFTFSDGTSF